MSTTPRTDLACIKYAGKDCGSVYSDFARQLETELAETRTDLTAITSQRDNLKQIVGDVACIVGRRQAEETVSGAVSRIVSELAAEKSRVGVMSRGFEAGRDALILMGKERDAIAEQLAAERAKVAELSKDRERMEFIEQLYACGHQKPWNDFMLRVAYRGFRFAADEAKASTGGTTP